MYLVLLCLPREGNVVNLHNCIGVPENGVVVITISWVEPRLELHLALAKSLGVNVCVNCVRLPCGIA